MAAYATLHRNMMQNCGAAAIGPYTLCTLYPLRHGPPRPRRRGYIPGAAPPHGRGECACSPRAGMLYLHCAWAKWRDGRHIWHVIDWFLDYTAATLESISITRSMRQLAFPDEWVCPVSNLGMLTMERDSHGPHQTAVNCSTACPEVSLDS